MSTEIDNLLAGTTQKPGAGNAISKRVRRLGDDEASTKALMIWGPPGSGKTRTLKTLLERGERLLIGDTEPSGDGVSTVERLCKQEGKTELLANALYVPLYDWDEVWNFWGQPADYVEDLTDFDPTVLVWENFNYFQLDMVDQKIMPEGFRAEAHKDDKDAAYAYWDKVRRATLRPHARFMHCHPTRPAHHILTLHDDDRTRTDKKGNLLDGPQIQGSARKPILGSYSLILRTERHSDVLKPGHFDHVYTIKGGTELQVKERAVDLPHEFPADFDRVWSALVGPNKNTTN